MINLNEYLDVFNGAKTSNKIGEKELNKIILNNMPNGWISQAYVQFFYCGYNPFNKYVNIFELVEIAEYIYEGVVEHSY